MSSQRRENDSIDKESSVGTSSTCSSLEDKKPAARQITEAPGANNTDASMSGSSSEVYKPAATGLQHESNDDSSAASSPGHRLSMIKQRESRARVKALTSAASASGPPESPQSPPANKVATRRRDRHAKKKPSNSSSSSAVSEGPNADLPPPRTIADSKTRGRQKRIHSHGAPPPAATTTARDNVEDEYSCSEDSEDLMPGAFAIGDVAERRIKPHLTHHPPERHVEESSSTANQQLLDGNISRMARISVLDPGSNIESSGFSLTSHDSEVATAEALHMEDDELDVAILPVAAEVLSLRDEPFVLTSAECHETIVGNTYKEDTKPMAMAVPEISDDSRLRVRSAQMLGLIAARQEKEAIKKAGLKSYTVSSGKRRISSAYQQITDDSKPRVKSAQSAGLLAAQQEKEAIKQVGMKLFSQVCSEAAAVRTANEIARAKKRGIVPSHENVRRHETSDTMVSAEVQPNSTLRAQKPADCETDSGGDGEYEVQEYDFATDYDTSDYEFSTYKSVYDDA